ncbi:iron-containing alcohol dehydrogenase [Pseudomonas syringae]|uniref:iron-containing alcohol dehydrogenase n=1 Tax=Pseudomonas syringae TaxID=317 RepID=UPI00200B2BB4|nr:iron-containing alcohol dehydrogenase [Pseudomonas syringae]MCK9720868.1 iron-containing alcohol dehydrogenase [Pseudomonas syringae pv. syringae]
MHRNDWHYPTSIRAGAGRVNELADACRVTGIQRPLLITDSFLGSTDMIASAVEDCRSQLGHCGLFDRVKGNPTGTNVAEGLHAYRTGGYDGVIAFGGGSALDAAKAVALMSGQTRPLWEFEDINDNHLRADPAGIAPVIALPMDATLTVDLPRHLTAATGADALTHCMESWCSPAWHPMAEAVSVKGMQMIKAFLPRVVADGQDLEARQQMLVASSLGAAAFQRGLGGVHAIAQSLGALYDQHHGLLNAILLPYVLEANRSVLQTQMDDLAVYLRLPSPGFSGVMDWLLTLREQIGIPHTLSEIGIDDREAERVGRMAFVDGCSHTNPIRHSAQVYAQIFSRAVRGE